MAYRETISNELRFKIFKRDNFTCQYCGRKAPDVEIQIDHIVSVFSGGDNRASNLITACYKCNLGKLCARVEEKEDKESIEEFEKNRLSRMSKYSYYTNYICKVMKNANIKLPKRKIDKFTAVNFSNDEEFNNFKKIFYEKSPEEVLHIIEDCFYKKLKYSTYTKCYTEERKTLLEKYEINSLMDSEFLLQIHYLMRDYWCDYSVKYTEYVMQIAEYFEDKYQENNYMKIGKIDKQKLFEISNILLCLTEFIKEKDERMIDCFKFIDEYFEQNENIQFHVFIAECIEKYMSKSGWDVSERAEKPKENFSENEKKIIDQKELDKTYRTVKRTFGVPESLRNKRL